MLGKPHILSLFINLFNNGGWGITTLTQTTDSIKAGHFILTLGIAVLTTISGIFLILVFITACIYVDDNLWKGWLEFT